MKRIISTLIALTLIMCLIPAALAAEGGEPIDTVENEDIIVSDAVSETDDSDISMDEMATINDVHNSERLTAALADANEELIINITASFNHSTPIDLGVNDQSIIINLRGNTLTLNVQGTALLIRDGVSLTINGPGTLRIYSTGTSSTTYGRGIEVYGTGSILSISGGAIVSAAATGVSTGDYDSLGAYAHTGGTINITSAAATGLDGVGAMTSHGGTINISGNAVANGDGYAYGAAAWGGTINIEGYASGSYIGAHAQSDGVITIKGDAIGTGSASYGSYGASVASGGKIFVTGSIFGTRNDVIIDLTGNQLVTRSMSNPTRTEVAFPPPQYGHGYYWDEFTADGASVIYKRQEEIDSSKIVDFVTRLYNNILDRGPDQEGLDGWVTMLKNQTSTGAQVAYGFFFSKEMIAKNLSNGDFVEILYKTLLNRASDADGKNFWVNQLDGGWPREDIFAGFANSVEFLQLCADAGITRGTYTPPAGGEIYAFVTRLYTICLDRKPDKEGLDDWVAQLQTGKATGTQVGQGFIFSAEMNAKNLNNNDFVEILYKAFLGRNPDEQGLADWVKELNSNSQTRQQVFSGFANSKEFGNICVSYGIKQK